MDKAQEEIIGLLKKETKLKDISLEVPPDTSMGDYAFPCFQLSKSMKKNPVEIAKELAEKLKPKGLIKEIKEQGPYLNFFIDKQKLAEKIIKKVLKEKDSFGAGKKKKEKIVLEYVSPNTNKCLHIGHVRNGLLGEALARISEFDGFEIVRTSQNNDKGRGMTEAMMGYLKFHDGETPKDMKPDHFVAKCYVDFKKAENDELKKEVDLMTKHWEDEEPRVREIWKRLTSWVYEGYKETYAKLGILFDKEYYESEIYKKGKKIVMGGLKKGIFEKEDDAVIADLEDFKLPKKVLIKSDGTSLYITQDIYLAKLKHKDFSMDRSIYVVASEQDNYFRQLFKILEMLDFKFADKCHHLSYGLVNLPSGRMKSREGKVVDADDLIEEMENLALAEIQKRHKDIPEKEMRARAEIIGMGALKFFMLKFDNVTSFTYNPEESLSFEGETGPYVQYAHARICSILERYGKDVEDDVLYDVLKTEQDEKLIVLLSRFSETIEKSAESYSPHILARYLLDLSQGFNEFYHSCPVLDADEDVKKARLFLVSAVKQVLQNGLELLGIKAPKRM
ncbi:arginine--tRNA ligase [Candidatus Woesearchaeota archaeon]|nr:arginine--tRNA ligase [Candidatus Woesearchaeota archaeon]